MALAMSLLRWGESLFDSPEGKIEAVFAPVLSHVPVSAPPIAIGDDEVSVRETHQIAESIAIGGVTKLASPPEGD